MNPLIVRVAFLLALFTVLVVFVSMGYPTWLSLLVGLVVLLYVGYIFAPKKTTDVSAKKNRVVCWNCHYDNKKGVFVCKECKVKLKSSIKSRATK
jgi:hypothetical protein